MKEAYILDQDFENTDPSQLRQGEYENCTFSNCNFEYLDLSGFSFTDCEFILLTIR
jgi:fluoroquinolone resistance protein